MRIHALIILLSFILPSLANEPISMHWPMPQYNEYANEKMKQIWPDMEIGAGVRLPMLMTFSAGGKLVWIGNPLDHSADIRMAENSESSTDLFEIFDRIEKAQGNSSSPLSSRIALDQPTSILVVFSQRQGVCPPCDRAKQEVLDELPQRWNRFLISVFID